MCDSLSFKYRIEGSPRVLAKVVQTINQYQKEYGEDTDGLSSRVCKNADGSLSWSGWAYSLMWELDRALVKLTRRNATRIWAYHGENNDNYIRGWILSMEKGSDREDGFWAANVGYDAAMAAIELEQSANADAAMVLLKELERACDRPGRLSAVLAEMMLEALHRHPNLVTHDSIWSRITNLRSQIAASSVDSEAASGDYEMDPQRINWLFAKIESCQLADCLTAPTGEACPPKAVRL
jgi:hypothetical protein